MAEIKSFLYYLSFDISLSKLKKESDRLRFQNYIIQYGLHGVIPKFTNDFEEAFFNDFKQVIDRDKAKWNEALNAKSEGGKKHKGNQYTRAKEMELSSNNWNTLPKNGSNGTVNVNDNVNVNGNVIVSLEERKEEFYIKAETFRGQYSGHYIKTFAEYYTQPLQAEPDKMLFESFKVWDLATALQKWREPPEPTRSELSEQEQERIKESNQRHEEYLQAKANAVPMPEDLAKRLGLKN